VLVADGEAGDLLLERDNELRRISGCVRRASEGRGRVIVVEGPAGIGKTAILGASGSLAEQEGFRVLLASGFELEREYAFGLVRQLFEPVIASSSPEDLVQLLKGPPAMAVRLLGLSGIPEGSGTNSAWPEDPSFAVLHGLYWLCVNLSAGTPLALVIDDLHWADRPSLRFLLFLLPRISDSRILLIVAARPSEAGPNQRLIESLVVAGPTEVLTADPLSPTAVAKVAAAVLWAEPEPAFTEVCHEVTGGLPFLVWRILQALRAEGVPPVAASVPEVRRAGTPSLGRWALQRLGQLGSDPARVACALAVLESAELAQAAQLAALGAVEAAESVDLLARAGILDVSPLRFRHPLLRAAVYAEIGSAERSEMHRRAAAVLAGSDASLSRVAEHLLLADPARDSWVIERLRTAAQEAFSRGSPESAASYLRRALQEGPPQVTEAAVLLELGLAEFSSGRPGWREHLERAVQKAPDKDTRVTAAVAAASALAADQQFAQAAEICDQVAGQLEGQAPEDWLLLETLAVNLEMSTASLTTRRPERARRLIKQAEDPSTPRHTLAIAANFAVCSNRPADQAAELARRAVSVDPSHMEDSRVPAWLLPAISALRLSERSDEAQRLLDAAVTEARATANAFQLSHLLYQRALLALRRSDLTAAEADARALLDTHGVFPPIVCRQMATSALVSVLRERGEFELAELELDRLGNEVDANTLAGSLVRHARGRPRFAQRRYRDALDDFQRAGIIANACQATSPCFMPWRSDTALTWLAMGDSQTAQRQAQEEVVLARVFGAPRALGIALRAAGLVAGGSEGENFLRQSIQLLDSHDTRLEWSYALTDLGALLRRTNRRTDARHPLRQAVDCAHHLGATVLGQRAETELRATGAKPRRVQLSGLEALTASERRVAELASEGLTNREVAQTLFVTARTVEGHLTHVFQKLNITARTDLLRALEAPVPAATG
jgi:DNA-binding CsgD family transcriptional regulator